MFGCSYFMISKSILITNSAAWWAPTKVCRCMRPSLIYLYFDLNMFPSCSRVSKMVTFLLYFAATTVSCFVLSLNCSFYLFILVIYGWWKRYPSRKKLCNSKTLSLDLLLTILMYAFYLFFVMRWTGLPSKKMLS